MNFRKGRIPFVIFAIIPDSCAISISPIHNAMTPAMVMQRLTASLALSNAASRQCAHLPGTDTIDHA